MGSRFFPNILSRVSPTCFCPRYWKEFPFSAEKPRRRDLRLLCSPNGNGGEAIDVSDVHLRSANNKGSEINGGTRSEKAFTSNELMQWLKRYGISGILSYGLLNTAYYVTTFLLVWFYIAPVPGRMGYAAAVERALALAPLVDRGLSWFTVKLKFESQWKAFMTIVGFCFGLALPLFFMVTLLWA